MGNSTGRSCTCLAAARAKYPLAFSVLCAQASVLSIAGKQCQPHTACLLWDVSRPGASKVHSPKDSKCCCCCFHRLLWCCCHKRCYECCHRAACGCDLCQHLHTIVHRQHCFAISHLQTGTQEASKTHSSKAHLMRDTTPSLQLKPHI